MKKLAIFATVVFGLYLIAQAQGTPAVVVDSFTFKDNATRDRIAAAVTSALAADYRKFRKLDDADPGNDLADNGTSRANFLKKVAARHLLEITRGWEQQQDAEAARSSKKTEQDSALVDPPE